MAENKTPRRLCGFLAIPMLLVPVAPIDTKAAELIDLAQQAEQLLGSGDGLAAYEKMRLSMVEVSEKIPLDIRKAFFVTERPVIFGNYSRAKSNEFTVGSSLITYAEPVGLVWKQIDGGDVQSQFTVDFELRNPAGEVLAVQKAFGNFKIASREPLFEIYTPLTLDVSAVPAGDYVLKYTFNDLNSKKSTDIEQRFKLK
ncbi:hypothetical protein JJB09_12485 [Rhizobium sp. KVB221]|uniref:Uncharacterized protein n=1 Tax=Rhizobium setariae TaxID=2801340 RepID=A0A937CQC6_9HYPH|nr:hypothetical protein [Rhizobium setariae]MBL0372847.1 hypothetical protein [Rhizobium setariae]